MRANAHQDEIDRRVGAMVRSAAMADVYLGLIAQELCASPHASYLVSGETTRRTIDICKKLLDVTDKLDEKERATLRELLSKLGPLVEQRDRYVHGTSVSDQHGVYSTYRPRKKKPDLEVIPIDLDDLDKLALLYDRLSWELGAFNALTFHPEEANMPDVDE